MMQFISKYRYSIILFFIVCLAIVVRVWAFGTVPPSPYWEEVALGYDAYSLLQTGKDHHGNFFPIVAFESFGDWKPSLYFYLSVPAIAVFGLNEFAVRLPSLLAGIGLVLLLNRLPQLLLQTNQLTKNQWRSDDLKKLGLLAAFLCAIEPWGILFSRAAWEANVAVFLITLGVVSFLIAFFSSKRRWIWLVISVLSFGLSMYCYHAARLISPLLLFSLMIWQLVRTMQGKAAIKQTVGQLLVAGVLYFLFISPILLSLASPQVSSRFTTENIFTNIEIIEQSNQFKELAQNSVWSRIQFHRYGLFLRQVVSNYSSYFTVDFLFNTGDSNLRHSSGFFGLLYPLDLLFLLIGFVYLLRKQRAPFFLLLSWLLIGLLPAAISQPNPHALRALSTLPVWLCYVAIGIYIFLAVMSNQANLLVNSLIVKLGWKKGRTNQRTIRFLVSLLLICTYVFFTVAFMFYYVNIYPKRATTDWVYGYQQLYDQLDTLEQRPEYRKMPVYITRWQGRPAMYDWFYHATEPEQVQAQNASVVKDQGEFLTFENNVYIRELYEVSQRPAIVAASTRQWQLLDLNSTGWKVRPLATIPSLDNEEQWQVNLVE